MWTEIPYGQRTVWLEIPDRNLIGVVRPPESSAPVDEAATIFAALTAPIGTPTLSELAREAQSVAILVSDITRPCPSFKFLPALLDQLSGIPPARIRVIFGLGTHRPHCREEQAGLIGEETFQRAQVLDFDPDDVRLLGTTRQGTLIELFRPFLEADLKIATGNIEYHYFAGFSGGAKAVMPGIASRRAIEHNHSLLVLPGAQAGELEGNPLRRDIEEVGERTGIDFIVNVVLNERKEIVEAVAGHPQAAFHQGVRRYEALYRSNMPEKADIVVVSPGGFPKDLNFYQAHKALENVKRVVRPGGTILLAASCPEGIGDRIFQEWLMGMNQPEQLIDRFRRSFVLGGHKAVSLARLRMKVRLLLVSEMRDGLIERIGLEPVETLQAGLDKLLVAYGRSARVLVVPFGQMVQPPADLI
jgi:nickel-dependent lactate racemase